jgi:thiamine biosynthesis lipoprotein
LNYLNDVHKSNIKEIINKIDYVASNYKVDSEISIINNKNSNIELKISDDLYNILSLANKVEELSNNAYDIKLGKLSSNLGFSPNFNKKFDTSIDPESSYKLIDKNILIKQGNFWFDLSSIAKGYAVDMIVNYLEENNYKDFIVEIGGELTLSGSNYGKSWTIAIQDPHVLNNKPAYFISPKNINKISVATSGEYRNFKFDGVDRISHTINPMSGKSIINDASSVTVLSTVSSAHADAFATALNVLSISESLDLANNENIALMLIVEGVNGDNEFIFSNKWYDLTR